MLKKLIHNLIKKNNKNNDSERIIYEMFYKRVYFIAYYIVKDHDLAQDVVQETFLKAFKRMHTVHDSEKLGAWLATIASTTALDYYRKIKRWNDVPSEIKYIDEQLSKSDMFTLSVESIVEEKMFRNIIFQEINKLKPEYKQVLVLKYMHDMKQEEIAEALGINVSTVKTRIHRANLILRESLKKIPDIGEVVTYGEK